MTNATCWELAQAWYTGRIERNWQRPDQQQMQRLFENLGLTGSFWDLNIGK